VEAEELTSRAIQVLRSNDAGGWTRPSAHQYPHQWNWDSALVSLGWSWIDWERAVVEIESLLEAQWDNGMVPHVRYDPEFAADYFPGPDRWPNAARHLPRGVLSSGISNPPILVTAARSVAERAPSSERGGDFLRRVYPALERWLRFFASERRLDDCPLIAEVHPWESGWDNSPRWDHLRAARLKPKRPFTRQDREHVGAEHRPEDRDYEAYLALVELLDECDYSIERYRQVSPFVVNDLFLDATWYRAARDLNDSGTDLGLEPAFSAAELDEFAAAFEERHWDPTAETYFDYDVVSGGRLEVPTPAGIAATISGLVPADRALKMWNSYLAEGPGVRPVWTLSPRHPGFDPIRYWRGPVWVHLNWLIALGLLTAGLPAQAAALRSSTIELVSGSGFHEHYSPLDGTGGGAPSFSWSAALTLDMLRTGS
jgi:hypothetical protein